MKKKMAIISSYFEDESYGLLGPQIAATIIGDNASYECIVIAVTNNDDKALIKKELFAYFGNERPVIGFSTLSGRQDLFDFGKALKDEGATTILAGPQAHSDFLGEKDWKTESHRFHGLSDCFSFSIHGPAEQAIPLLDKIDKGGWEKSHGLLYVNKDGAFIQNSERPWDESYLRSVRWDNLYRVTEKGLQPLEITTGQVLQQIGCPHASRESKIDIDYPTSVKGHDGNSIEVSVKGCSFCDVAIDKGFYGELNMDTVLEQINSLPEDGKGRKIPFELINENPLFRLPDIFKKALGRNIHLSQINLIMRADWLLKGEDKLREALKIAKDLDYRIFASSVGFEAFDETLLKNFNKGLDIETNLKAVRLMRRFKEEFPEQWGYSRSEGAVHGFIHPTPWDTKQTFSNTQKNIAIYGLNSDILPSHSTPLIIHHSSALGDWIREVEKREMIRYKRHGSIIGWWEMEC